MNPKNFLRAILPVSLTVLMAAAALAAETVPQKIPLPNAGLENGLADWSVPPQFAGQVSIVDSPVHSGAKAVKIDASANANLPFISIAATDLTAGATYQFSAWARVAPGAPAVQAAVKMENYNARGNNTSGMYGRAALPADGAWKQISVTLRADADSTRSNLLLRVFGKSAVIFDDVTFTLIKDAPEVIITSNQQILITPHRSRRITYFLTFKQPWKEKGNPEITANLRPLGAQMGSSETHLIRAYVNRSGDRKFTANITVPALAVGDYAVDFGYYRDGKFLQTDNPAYLFMTAENRKPQNLTDNGTILWQGKPFFPIGMYHPGNNYKILSENGFNAVQGSSAGSLDQFKASLDEAQKYGLAVDVPLYANGQVKKNLPSSLEKIQKFGNHPSILCWKIKDEPDIASNADVAVEVPAVYRALKAADPNHPIELTLANDATLGFWSNFCDIMQIDRYPVRGADDSSDLTQVATFSRNAKSVLQPWQNLTFDVQSGWTLDLSTQPSVAQARSMVYLALTSGAKGIFWYSMTEGSGWDLTKTPLWPHMKEINSEIKTISEPIMNGVDVPVQTSNLRVYVMAKKYQNKLYVFFTNPTQQSMHATFRISAVPQIKDGAFVKTAFTGANEKIEVAHSTGAPNSITMTLKGLQSGTMVFDINGQ